jgi:hypothetical protein
VASLKEPRYGPSTLPAASRELTRDEKVENLVMNFSMIMMGMFEGVFAALAGGMADAMTKTADVLAEALDGTGVVSPGTKPSVDVNAEVNGKMKEVFSGLRKEVAEGFSDKNQAFKSFIKDTSFDQGVRIVESHRLKLPRLTEPLSDADLAGYVHFIQSEDPDVSKMMHELGEWQKTTPKFGH